MAIVAAVCNTFKVEVLKGTHNMGATGDSLKLCLITSSATASKATTNYTDVSPQEVASSGTYASGGGALTNADPALSTDTAVCDFTDISFTAATITARGALIYNTSKSNKAIQVLNFTTDQTSTAGTFAITFPVPAAGTAILGLA